MRKWQSSLTTAGIAAVRAIESEKPAGERVCYDPYARRFAGAGLYHVVQFFTSLGYANWRGPGLWEFLVARERYIDDYLETRLSEGLEQLVILGAGYDARAYRFEALKAGKVFEVDHPALRPSSSRSWRRFSAHVRRTSRTCRSTSTSRGWRSGSSEAATTTAAGPCSSGRV